MATCELIGSTTLGNNTTHSVTFSGISTSDDYQQFEILSSCRLYETTSNPQGIEFWYGVNGVESGYTFGGIVSQGSETNIASPWRDGGYAQEGGHTYRNNASYWNVTAIGGDWTKGKAFNRIIIPQAQGDSRRKCGQIRMWTSFPRNDSYGHFASHYMFNGNTSDLTSITLYCNTPSTSYYFAEDSSFMLYGIKDSNA